MRWYVGVKGAARKAFKADVVPTRATHGDQFGAVIGPFRTKRGAMFAAAFGHNNPHFRTTADAERIAKGRTCS
jgi:hypothetical protein